MLSNPYYYFNNRLYKTVEKEKTPLYSAGVSDSEKL